ncbi:MAG: ATP-binding cassette domain-containing protein [Planctomycetaceae bacterium]|jgi:ABC-type sugar transport system ATPase subunit|nr:ATP-binding cassette domain-containing protein [Planctomycetaceae bacterium]
MIMLDAVTVRSGGFELRDVRFAVPTGSYGVLMGRTGSGKSTVLEAICGLRPVAAGTIRLGNRDVTRLPAAARDIGYVPQDRVLFSHMSVGRQIALPLEVRRWPRDTILPRVVEVAVLLGIEPLLTRHPAGLSGGEAQRVALARALVFRPEVLLLDEPLTGLDEATRAGACDVLADVHRSTGVTVLHVTHDSRESRRLAEVCFVIENGAVARRDAALAAGAMS